jgi:hypothetical protein
MNDSGSASKNDRTLQEVLDRLKELERALAAINERTENLVKLYATAAGASNVADLRALIERNAKRSLWIAGLGVAAVLWAAVTVYMTINSQWKAINRLEEVGANSSSAKASARVAGDAPPFAMRRIVTSDGVIKEVLADEIRLTWWDSRSKTEASDPSIVPVTSATKILIDKKAVALSELRAGMRVRCYWAAGDTKKPPFRIEVVNP